MDQQFPPTPGALCFSDGSRMPLANLVLLQIRIFQERVILRRQAISAPIDEEALRFLQTPFITLYGDYLRQQVDQASSPQDVGVGLHSKKKESKRSKHGMPIEQLHGLEQELHKAAKTLDQIARGRIEESISYGVELVPINFNRPGHRGEQRVSSTVEKEQWNCAMGLDPEDSETDQEFKEFEKLHLGSLRPPQPSHVNHRIISPQEFLVVMPTTWIPEAIQGWRSVVRLRAFMVQPMEKWVEAKWIPSGILDLSQTRVEQVASLHLSELKTWPTAESVELRLPPEEGLPMPGLTNACTIKETLSRQHYKQGQLWWIPA